MVTQGQREWCDEIRGKKRQKVREGQSESSYKNQLLGQILQLTTTINMDVTSVELCPPPIPRTST